MLPTVTPLGLGLSHASAPRTKPFSPPLPGIPAPWTLSRLAGALRQRSVNPRLPRGSLRLFTVCRKSERCTLRSARAHATLGGVAAEAGGARGRGGGWWGHVPSHRAVSTARWQRRGGRRSAIPGHETLEDREMHFFYSAQQTRKSLLCAKHSACVLHPPRCLSRRLWP